MNPARIIKAGVTAWKVRKDWFGDGGVPVSPELAQQRADTCNRCPMNQEKPVWELFAGPVAWAVKQQFKLKSELKLRVNGEENLHVCSICNCILGLKIFVPLKFIDETEGLPDFCWQQTEKQNLQHDNTNDRLPE